MDEIQLLKSEIQKIKERNKKVEEEKAWETSNLRIFSILTLTYLGAIILFYILKAKTPFLNALIPTFGYYLSTRSVSFIKKHWMKKEKDLTS